MHRNKIDRLLEKTNIVGVIASERDMGLALENPDDADVAEWRVDCIPNDEIELGLRELKKPVIITVRDAKEGGKQASWGIEDRAEKYRRYMRMGLAAFVDIEASTAESLRDVILEAREAGIGVIISYHDFEKTPSNWELIKIHRLCQGISGDVLKIAVVAQTMADLTLLARFAWSVRNDYRTKVAAMAMGKLGKISRLMSGFDGAPLVYSCFGEAHVEGQWRASELREILGKL
jgi:3-dehydroquinate dehydratase-1